MKSLAEHLQPMAFHAVVVKLSMGAEMSPEKSTEGLKDPLPSALTLLLAGLVLHHMGVLIGLPYSIAAGFNL